MIVPLFKSHYSLGKSILTLEKPEDVIEDGPDSIIKLCLDSGIDEMFLVEDSISGFLQAFVNAKENNIKLNFGLRITFCADMYDKSAESLETNSKYIIFCKNRKGYERLIKIYTLAAKKGFYYHPRLDFDALKEFWGEKDLLLAVPFYDSFLHNNFLKGKSSMPDFSYAEPVFLTEDNKIPFDYLIKNRIKNYTKNKHETVSTKSIFYAKKKDFKAYITFRCINKRSTLDKPNLDHMSSDEFSLESWGEAQ
jgi:DNA polymerase-3 subunit alpha